MKGIILAGGSGTRLYPLTRVVSKQLLPVYDKPMIYYPLSVLMLSGIRRSWSSRPDRPPEVPRAPRRRLGVGDRAVLCRAGRPQRPGPGVRHRPGVRGADPVALILGDNIFHGDGLSEQLQRVAADPRGGDDLRLPRQGPPALRRGRVRRLRPVVGLQEKPEHPKSSYAVVGLYFYDTTSSTSPGT